LEFHARVLAGQFARMQGDLAERRSRAVPPNRVDRIWLNENEPCARGFKGLAKALDLAR
jgi:hypothetical protein